MWRRVVRYMTSSVSEGPAAKVDALMKGVFFTEMLVILYLTPTRHTPEHVYRFIHAGLETDGVTCSDSYCV
jgi:hypothetical protein